MIFNAPRATGCCKVCRPMECLTLPNSSVHVIVLNDFQVFWPPLHSFCTHIHADCSLASFACICPAPLRLCVEGSWAKHGATGSLITLGPKEYSW